MINKRKRDFLPSLSLPIVVVFSLLLSACNTETSTFSSNEKFVFFVQYTNAAFGESFKAVYINAEGEAVTAEDSTIPELTVDGEYTQDELDSFYFHNRSLILAIAEAQMDQLSAWSATVEKDSLEQVSPSSCQDAGNYRYGFYVQDPSTQNYEEFILYETTGEGIYLNNSNGAEDLTKYMMELAVFAEIAFSQIGPCAGYWYFE
ncbi:hypothetical protein [Pleionea sediminis]|uniref:hypothetical protein n=1 Tax=Pleionea sediminis TaxID=2569479 RepID=UPI001186D0D5|nr:hypothetical protein [Pleionea sediminis]